MIVVTRAPSNPGLGRTALGNTSVWPQSSQRIREAREAAGGWAIANRATPGFGRGKFDSGLSRYGMRGLGQGDGPLASVPTWAWWLGGGVLAGVAVGFVVSK